MYEQTLIITNAKIVTPTGIIDGDVGIGGGKIQSVGKKIALRTETAGGNAVRLIDGTGLFVLPGAIDMHVHFRDPGFPKKEDFGSGSAAAASGGVTTVFDMPNTSPPTVTAAALADKRARAAATSCVNYGFYMGFTGDNLEEIRRAEAAAGVKLYMADSTGEMGVSRTQAIEELLKLGLFTIVHAEDAQHIHDQEKRYQETNDPSVHSLIRSDEAALTAVKTILHLGKKYDARLHITHISSRRELDELKKFHGLRVSADCTPHHLFLAQSAYADRGNFVKMNPPLRTNEDRQSLWKALRAGIVDAVASDHAPHTKAEKEQPYIKAPAGVPGVETMVPLLLDAVNHGELTLRDIARLTSENPARLLGLKGKGRVEAGFDADIVLVDMARETEVGLHGGPNGGYFSKCGWSPFGGWKLKGWPICTVVGGEVVFENGKINAGVRGKELGPVHRP